MAKTITTSITIQNDCLSNETVKMTCKIIDLRQEYPNSLLANKASEAKYAVVSNLSAEELIAVEELKCFEPYVVITSEMYDVIKESNRNDEREQKRRKLYHDIYALDDEMVSTQLLSPDAIAESNYTYEHILNEIRRLPGLQGRRFYQRYVLGLSVETIAKSAGVGISTVYESLRKAKNAIHNVFLDEEVAA